MDRDYLRTPDEFMAVEFARVMLLFGQALPTEADRIRFEELTHEASAKGLNWIQALEYAAARQQRRPHLERGARVGAGVPAPVRACGLYGGMAGAY